MPSAAETMCPVTQEVCPALVELQTLYVGNEDRVEPEVASSDRRIYTVKRGEYLAAVAVRGCDEACPVRQGMDHSPIRKGLARSVRTLLGRTTP